MSGLQRRHGRRNRVWCCSLNYFVLPEGLLIIAHVVYARFLSVHLLLPPPPAANYCENRRREGSMVRLAQRFSLRSASLDLFDYTVQDPGFAGLADD